MVIPGFLLLLLLQLSICGNCWPDIPCIDNDFVTGTLIFIASYVVGLICHKVVECIFEMLGFRNKPERIKKIGNDFKEQYQKYKTDKEPYNLHQYYGACYSLMGKYYLNSIPTLEAQVVF